MTRFFIKVILCTQNNTKNNQLKKRKEKILRRPFEISHSKIILFCKHRLINVQSITLLKLYGTKCCFVVHVLVLHAC